MQNNCVCALLYTHLHHKLTSAQRKHFIELYVSVFVWLNWCFIFIFVLPSNITMPLIYLLVSCCLCYIALYSPVFFKINAFQRLKKPRRAKICKQQLCVCALLYTHLHHKHVYVFISMWISLWSVKRLENKM